MPHDWQFRTPGHQGAENARYRRDFSRDVYAVHFWDFSLALLRNLHCQSIYHDCQRDHVHIGADDTDR